MRLRSAFEDFESRTLAAVAGLLGRFSYVGTLHAGGGIYKHWGLTKIYGEDAAQRAICSSHRGLLTAILRKPLAWLLTDVSESCAKGEPEEEFLTTLVDMQPKPASPAAKAHLKSVLNALLALVENRSNASHQDASQPR